jgi:hypothetical protein
LLQALVRRHRGYYGSPRIHNGFVEWGEHGGKRIIRVKQEEAHWRVRKRYKITTDSGHDQPLADN